jgi:DNA polymerase-3 subunit beta
MKAVVLQETLSKALSVASRVVSTKPNLPVLSNIYLEARDKTLIIAATDLDIGVKLSVKAEIEKEGVIAVPARLFVDFVSSLSAGEVHLETEALILRVKSGPNTSSFNCLDGKEFPTFPQKGEKMLFSFPQREFKTALGRVLFSSSTDASRQILTGVYFEISGQGITLVSTDGFRLSTQKISAKKYEQESFIIPARGLSELTRSGENEEGDKAKEIQFFLTENENQIIVQEGQMEMVLRLLEGKFPDYKKIVPAQYVLTAHLDGQELLKAVKVGAIFARDNANILHLSLNPEEGTLALSAQAREMGEGSSKLSVKMTGEPMEISFNARFLNDCIGVLAGEQLQLEFSGALKPVKITSENIADYYHILMPVRTGN